MTNVLKIEGMSCQNCARHVREALQDVPGVEYAEVDLDAGSARVKGGTPGPELKALVEAVGRAGYTAAPERTDTKKAAPGAGWRFNMIFALAVAAPLMAIEHGLHPAMGGWFGWVSFTAVLPVQVLCGWRFYRGAWQQLLVGQANMDMLVALGSTAAFLLSVYGLFAPGRVHHLYFSEAAMILGLISLGHYLEARVGERAAGALEQLMRLAPQKARRIAADGTEETVPLDALAHADRVVLSPGDQAPADGEVIEGESAVDESMLTGESAPIEKSPGAKIYTGTVNQTGRLVLKVTGLGEETALARIIEVVRRAQGSRASIQRIGDRVSSIFVPVVVLISAGTAAAYALHGGWEPGIINAAAVLIVACPCAMGLATPAAIMAGTNSAARAGILVRDGSALEKCGAVTAILFDKTGTLTEGTARVEKFITLPGSDEANALSLARALAAPSRHPYSKAIADYPPPDAPNSGNATLPPGNAELSEWREERGQGVSAKWRGKALFLGSLNALRERGVNLAPMPDFSLQPSAFSLPGALLGLAMDGKLLAVISLTDPLKQGAPDVVRRLRESGLRTCVVSGDTETVVRAIAAAAGIPPENVFAEVRPEAKAEIVQRLQAANEHVAFVGDGINDAPALAQADLGIAVTRASDVAREAADILLLNAGIEAIPQALDICRATLRTIKQNLFWAFFYNAAAIPLAAAGVLPPVACAAAMAISDIFVIGNSLRLLRMGRR
jgi:Cu+-exporting ATPase